jgi:peptidoglycan/xylan/chitin deacetylase (PgdA/CDA1 family)
MKELVLLFHGLGEPHHLVGPEELPYWLSAASFDHMLDQVLESSNGIGPGITITFDDGNASDAYLAFPALSKRALRASFFVCAGRIGKKHYLDGAMIKDLMEGGMSIGSHGMDHRDWRRLDPLALEAEVDDARRKLEDLIQRPVTTAAIPFGSYDRRVLNRLVCDRQEWECIYTSDRGIANGFAKIKPRETIDATMKDECLIHTLSAGPRRSLRLRRGLARLYKRLR